MDMKVDSQKLIQLRNARAWSQQHLADVSLSLRTIQRIEKTQSASHDSIGALASVFETTPDALLMGETHATTSHAQGQPTRKLLLRARMPQLIIQLSCRVTGQRR